MAKLTQELLEKYLDGELSPRKAHQVERLLEESPEQRESLAELARIGDMIRLMNAESLEKASFDGFKAAVEREVSAARHHPSMWSLMGVWLTEFIDNRRAVWVPAAATIGAVALVLALLPLSQGRPDIAASPGTGDGIRLHQGQRLLLSRIETVDFGDLTGTQYSIEDDRGGTIGVVWINEGP